MMIRSLVLILNVLSLLLFFPFLIFGLNEWCTDKLSVGTFQQTNDCIANEATVITSSKLSITGVENAELVSGIPRIFRTGHGAAKFRFFIVIESGELELTRVVLTGGDVEYLIGSEYSWGGGAIYASGPNTKIKILDSILYDNRAYAGGSIYASNKTNVIVQDSLIGGVTTTNTGGAMWCGFINTKCTIKGTSTRKLFFRFRLTRKQVTTMYPDLNDQSIACPFYSDCIYN